MKQNNSTELLSAPFPYSYQHHEQRLPKPSPNYVCVFFALFLPYFDLCPTGELPRMSAYKVAHGLVVLGCAPTLFRSDFDANEAQLI